MSCGGRTEKIQDELLIPLYLHGNPTAWRGCRWLVGSVEESGPTIDSAHRKGWRMLHTRVPAAPATWTTHIDDAFTIHRAAPPPRLYSRIGQPWSDSRREPLDAKPALQGVPTGRQGRYSSRGCATPRPEGQARHTHSRGTRPE